jgi:hypothetical protein
MDDLVTLDAIYCYGMHFFLKAIGISTTDFFLIDYICANPDAIKDAAFQIGIFLKESSIPGPY